MGVMFGYLRGLCFSQGFVPWELKIGSGMHRIYHAQMDVTSEDWVGDLSNGWPTSSRRSGRAWKSRWTRWAPT